MAADNPTTPPSAQTPVESASDIRDHTAAIDDKAIALQRLKDRENEAKEATSALAISNMDLTDRVENSRKALSSLSETMSAMATDVFGKITGQVSGFMDRLSNTNDLATQDMTKFGLATTAVLGPLKSFSNVSFPHINTFTGQFNEFYATIANNDTAIGKLVTQFGLTIPHGLLKGTKAFRDFVKSSVEATLQSADSAVKLEDVWTRSAATTGRLGALYSEKVGGKGLDKINKFIEDQRSAITNVGKAIHMPVEQVEIYYQQLMNLPVAYRAGTSEADRARGNTDQLANSIQLARGLGRDYADVLDDMRVAIRNYGASMPEAMKFTQQISEISGKYNVELKDVQNTLRGAAEAFKYFGNEGAGAAAVMNDYVSALEKVGVSGAVSADIVGNMFGQISKMSLAQKAFLSGQQGGPGGFMGAFDIDLKLRKGQFEEVSNMVKNQLTKMMGGNLVSTEEAAKSPAAASQMLKQVTILQNGPLGQFARTAGEAEDIIDALKGGKSIDFKALTEGQGGVEKAIEMGNTFAKQTATGMSELTAIARKAQGAASGALLNMVQSGLTAGAGFTYSGQEAESVQKSRAALSESMAAGARGVAKPANTSDIFREDLSNFTRDIGVHIAAVKDSMISMTTDQRKEMALGVENEYTAAAKRAKEEVMNIKDVAARKVEIAKIDKNEAMGKAELAKQTGVVRGANGNVTVLPTALIPPTEQPTSTTKLPAITPTDTSKALRPARTLPTSDLAATAATLAAKTAPTSGQPTTLHPANNPSQGQPGAVLGQMAVTVNIHCAKCGALVETTNQKASVTTAPAIQQGAGHDHVSP